MDIAHIVDAILEDIRPIIQRRVREHARDLAAEVLKSGLSDLLGYTAPLPTQSGRTVGKASAQRMAKDQSAGGKSITRVVEFMRSQPDGAAVKGPDILDYLRDVHGVENRESARKAVTRAREMGYIVRGSDNLWRATAKAKG